MKHLELLSRLAQKPTTGGGRIVLLVLDGVGDIVSAEQPQTALAAAHTPTLDRLAKTSALGRIVPVAPGVTPGSGPGHLALFGYDPTSPQADIGRGVLEGLGLGIDVTAGDVVARGNFVTVDSEDRITDRRAGRIPTAECERLIDKMRAVTDEAAPEGVEIGLWPGEAYRFVLRLRGEGLSPDLIDTDPQRTGVVAKAPQATTPGDEPAERTAEMVTEIISALRKSLAGEETPYAFTLRGFSSRPDLPGMDELYRLRLGCFAGYPLYRGVASTCGMEVVPIGKSVDALMSAVADHWSNYDYLFLHVKGTDQAGEDGNLEAKIAVIEEVDRALPRLLDLGPDVLAITGDHSTPAPMRAHSWHPVPLLVSSPRCFIDPEDRFDEIACSRGHLGTFASRELMGVLLGNAGRLAKYGA